MNESEISEILLLELGNIAHEANLASLDPKADFREALDIDSMDFLNLVAAIHRRLGVNVPETDYRKLFTLNDAVAYLKKALET